MENLIVKNLDTLNGEKIDRDGNAFTVKTIIPDAETSKCRANFVEVEPGNYAYGYHYHEANEEVFYFISGEGVVRTLDGEIKVKAGDVIGFPTGEKGAHVVKNESDEKLVYIDFGTTILPEIAHLPDFNKIMVIGKEVNGVYDK
ncbi:cupin domain-containing protein [Plebeiibacterium marinum]|uniref:Cupin domain-containing protein n=1 Tax=Plebeiibacterium marinum TaxID=2992111 RepID=A0AAE3SKX9_9BACT|nr:cupin domain-containing protein [Plebeiobacterium marinum]MCW3807112.1 cupin domain-containing protein [Plebeiobacterium marinum]